MENKTVSIIIPVYNEEKHLEEFCTSLFGQKFKFPTQFVFVDDGSKDRSLDILEKYSSRDDVLVHAQIVNQGKGAALAKGIELATADIIAIQDADFEYDPHDLDSLIDAVASGKADVVYGSRFKQLSPQVHRTYHYLGNRFLTLLSNLLSGIYLTDMETCYKVFKSEIIKGIYLECKRFGFEPEITAKLATLKINIHEYSISYHPRNYSAGKKIGWKDGVAAVWFIFKFNMLSSFLNLKLVKKDMLPQKYILAHKQWL